MKSWCWTTAYRPFITAPWGSVALFSNMVVLLQRDWRHFSKTDIPDFSAWNLSAHYVVQLLTHGNS